MGLSLKDLVEIRSWLNFGSFRWFLLCFFIKLYFRLGFSSFRIMIGFLLFGIDGIIDFLVFGKLFMLFLFLGKILYEVSFFELVLKLLNRTLFEVFVLFDVKFSLLIICFFKVLWVLEVFGNCIKDFRVFFVVFRRVVFLVGF